MKIHRLGRNQ